MKERARQRLCQVRQLRSNVIEGMDYCEPDGKKLDYERVDPIRMAYTLATQPRVSRAHLSRRDSRRGPCASFLCSPSCREMRMSPLTAFFWPTVGERLTGWFYLWISLVELCWLFRILLYHSSYRPFLEIAHSWIRVVFCTFVRISFSEAPPKQIWKAGSELTNSPNTYVDPDVFTSAYISFLFHFYIHGRIQSTYHYLFQATKKI